MRLRYGAFRVGPALVALTMLAASACMHEILGDRRNKGGDDAPPSAPVTPSPPPGDAVEPRLAGVDRILRAGCDGAACHGAGSPFGALVGSSARFKAKARAIAERVRSGSMPPATSGFHLSPDDQARLLAAADAEANTAPPATPQPSPPPASDGAGDADGDGSDDGSDGTMPDSAPRLSECPAPGQLPAPAAPLTFAADIAPIVAASCAGFSCHSAGASAQGRPELVGNEAGFLAAGNGVVFELKRQAMPPGAPLPNDQATRILQFLCP
jgi:hypothetical protein